MSIRKYAGDKITGLSSDTKPTNVPDGGTFYELDTGKVYVKFAGSWNQTSTIAANNQVAVGESAPISPSAGYLWWSSSTGRLYIYYSDIDSSQWVDISAAGSNEQYLTLTGGTVSGNVTITGNLTGNTSNFKSLTVNTSKTPSSASSDGNTGDMTWDSDYIYICVATNTWKRANLSSW